MAWGGRAPPSWVRLGTPSRQITRPWRPVRNTSWRGPGYGAQALNPAGLIDGGLDRADVVEVHGMRGSSHVPLWWT